MGYNHTTGPWHTKHDDTDGHAVWVKDDAGEAVAIMLGLTKRLPDNQANALLVAAAPELLAACESLVGLPCADDLPAVIEQAKLAIAKAKGE